MRLLFASLFKLYQIGINFAKFKLIIVSILVDFEEIRVEQSFSG